MCRNYETFKIYVTTVYMRCQSWSTGSLSTAYDVSLLLRLSVEGMFESSDTAYEIGIESEKKKRKLLLYSSNRNYDERHQTKRTRMTSILGQHVHNSRLFGIRSKGRDASATESVLSLRLRFADILFGSLPGVEVPVLFASSAATRLVLK
ncbi:hypothetical protein A0H81_02094 [Grifola frondosa]|uniref:Uncharacterized protein n=1 Tax=Grifola frondosa TaxID=5627 RepID=A0A1C7MMD2_GRIFR|nr:hypothetical protein A0H81_02094 [Grifola frondosa]